MAATGTAAGATPIGAAGIPTTGMISGAIVTTIMTSVTIMAAEDVISMATGATMTNTAIGTIAIVIK